MLEVSPRRRRRPRKQAQSGRSRIAALLVAALVVVLLVALLYPRPAPEPEAPPATRPPGEAAPEPPQAPAGAAPAPAGEASPGEQARALIAELRAGDGEPDYERAYRAARRFDRQGRLADAQLLYFFAARGGHGPAALALASRYDPLHHDPARALLEAPEPFQAYKWYGKAAAAGHGEANERLAALREWAQAAAAGGDTEAERLLLQWR